MTTIKEYKTAKGWTIFSYLSATLLIGFFGWHLILQFQNGVFSPNANWSLILLSITMITLIVFSVIDVYKSKLIIQENCIKYISIFSNKELKVDDIKGFAVMGQFIFIEPKNNSKKRITISKYIERYSEIILWLSQRFPDLSTF